MNYITGFHRIVSLLLLVIATSISSSAQSSSESTDTATAFEAQNLEDFVGRYGERTIGLSGSALTFQREGMPTAVSLKQVDSDTFEIIIPPGAIVQGHADGEMPQLIFARNEAGKVNALRFVMKDGTEVASSPKGAPKTDVN